MEEPVENITWRVHVYRAINMHVAKVVAPKNKPQEAIEKAIRAVSAGMIPIQKADKKYIAMLFMPTQEKKKE